MAKTGRPATNPDTVLLQAVRKALADQTGIPAKEPGPVSRMVRSLRNAYDAAGLGRRMVGWNPKKSGPNTALVGIERARERARDSSSNDWSAASAVDKWVTALIGVAITPRFKGIKNKDRREAVGKLYREFVKKSDADCVLNLYGQQTLAARTWLDGGECFIRRRRRFSDEGLPVPLQIQLLEADMVPLFDTDARQGLPEGNIIRSGIELNRRGKRVAIWFYKNHPGDNKGLVIGTDDLVRVAISDVIHLFEPKRPGQLRGAPDLVTVLPKLRDIADYEDAVLERQKLANLWVGFIKRVKQTLGYDTGAVDPVRSEAIEETDNSGTPLVGLQPGLIQELDDGQDITFPNPPEAGTTYSDYIRTSLLGVSAGVGLPYELHTGDLLNISDRTLRIAINEFRRRAEQRQWQIVIPQMCQRVIEWFADAALLQGDITLEEYDQVANPEHAPHGWPDIHPTQDIEGRAKAVEAGFRSRSSVIAAGGDDPEQVDQERADDKKRADDLGLTPPVVDPAAKPGAAPALAPKPAPAPAPKPSENRASTEEMELTGRIVALLEDRE